MYKRPSPFKHGSSSFTPLSQYDFQRLLTDRAACPLPVTKKKVFVPPKGIMYPETYKRLVHRSELTTEKREEIFQQYQKDGDTEKYLKAMHLYPVLEAENKTTRAPKKKDAEIFWGYAKLVLTIEGDHVKVHVDGKLGDIYANYLNKGKKPPLRPYIEALMSAGTPTEKVNKVIDGYVWWKKNKNELQADFNRLFPGEKKKGTVTQKKVLKAVIKH